MIATKELSGYLDEYLEEKQEIKNLTSETIKKQTFNINQFISYLENEGIEELDSTNVKKQLRHYRRYCLKGRGNKRTTVKTYMMNILEFINSEEVQEEIEHDPIKMKDIIEVKVEHPEIDVIMCGNDQIAVGAKTAVNVLDMKDVLIYGVDGSPDIKKELKK